MAFAYNVPLPLLNHEGNMAQNWERYKGIFKEADNLLNPKGDTRQRCSAMLLGIGEKGLEAYKALGLNDSEYYNWDAMLKRLDKIFNPIQNVIYKTFKFNTTDQKEGQSLRDYFTEIRHLADDCEFGQLKDRMVRDRIVVGIRDHEMRQKLLTLDAKNINLKKCMDIFYAFDCAQSTSAQMTNRQKHCANDVNVDKVKATDFHFQKKTDMIYDCKYCKGDHKIGFQFCPNAPKPWKQNKNRNKINYQNHRRQHQIIEEGDDSGSEDDMENHMSMNCDTITIEKKNLRIGSIHNENSSADMFRENIKIRNKLVNFKLDTGAEANTLSFKTFRHINGKLSDLQKTSVKLIAFDGTKIKPLGVVKLPCIAQGNEHSIKFFVTEKNLANLIGANSIIDMDLIQRTKRINQVKIKLGNAGLEKCDDEISMILKDYFGRVEKLIEQNKDKIKKISDLLIEKLPIDEKVFQKMTPVQDINKSPAAEILYGRNIRTKVPIKTTKLEGNWKDKMKFSKRKQKRYYDDKKAGTELQELKEGDDVRMKCDEESKVWRKATIKKRNGKRQYEAEDKDGMLFRQNRKLIHKP